MQNITACWVDKPLGKRAMFADTDELMDARNAVHRALDLIPRAQWPDGADRNDVVTKCVEHILEDFKSGKEIVTTNFNKTGVIVALMDSRLKYRGFTKEGLLKSIPVLWVCEWNQQKGVAA